jgi:peptidyl-prolyl isomerase E (cyclophilin E)
MEEGTKSKRTVYIGGLSEDTDESSIYETFSTFGTLVLFGALGVLAN